MRIVKPSVKMEWVTPDALGQIERAGRTCYRSEAKGDQAGFIRKRIREGHESILEHAVVSFRMVCDRGIMAEARTHRIASFSVESTRWCNYSKEKYGGEILVIEPLGMTPQMREIWYRNATMCEADYMAMLAAGATPQVARSVLSFSLASEFVVTTNFREWRHILALRTSNAAHPQMRELMGFTMDWFVENYPVIVEDILEPKAPKVFIEATLPRKCWFQKVGGKLLSLLKRR